MKEFYRFLEDNKDIQNQLEKIKRIEALHQKIVDRCEEMVSSRMSKCRHPDEFLVGEENHEELWAHRKLVITCTLCGKTTGLGSRWEAKRNGLNDRKPKMIFDYKEKLLQKLANQLAMYNKAVQIIMPDTDVGSSVADCYNYTEESQLRNLLSACRKSSKG